MENAPTESRIEALFGKVLAKLINPDLNKASTMANKYKSTQSRESVARRMAVEQMQTDTELLEEEKNKLQEERKQKLRERLKEMVEENGESLKDLNKAPR